MFQKFLFAWIASDTFVPADYDGDQRADLAVLRSGVGISNKARAVSRAMKIGACRRINLSRLTTTATEKRTWWFSVTAFGIFGKARAESVTFYSV